MTSLTVASSQRSRSPNSELAMKFGGHPAANHHTVHPLVTDATPSPTKTNKSGGRAANSETYKQSKPFAIRVDEVKAMRDRFPEKLPVVVERFRKEKQLPPLDKTKFLVPQDITVSQFTTIIRTRMKLTRNQAIYFLINNKSIASMSVRMSDLYSEFVDKDGFLYITYASQEAFG